MLIKIILLIITISYFSILFLIYKNVDPRLPRVYLKQLKVIHKKQIIYSILVMIMIIILSLLLIYKF